MTDRPAARPPKLYSFLMKVAGALLLVILADRLFFRAERVGSTLGGFAAAFLILTVCLRLETLRSWPSRVALLVAALASAAMMVDVGLLPLAIYAVSLTVAALLPRTTRFDDGWRWMQRLILHGPLALFGPLRDWMILRRARRRAGPRPMRSLAIFVLPLAGSIVFLTLFAQANPLIANALANLQLLPEIDALTIVRVFFWGGTFVMVWSVLRPPRVRLRPAPVGGDPEIDLPGVNAASVTLSLAAFNAIFALQNGLDLAYLWSNAPLPAGMTLAEYAHRGAYPLIATALLAGLFVLVTLRPGSATAGSRAIRLLVTLWIAQNLLLVASTMLRTFDYIDAYSLTRLRIAALVWMGLVAIGLALICARLLKGKSGGWLINANMLAALVVLGACTTFDLGRMAAAWNVRHAREVGGAGAAIDLCYLNQLGPSALLPLIELETRPIPRELRDRVQWLRSRTMARLAADQADWHGWTLRGARRLRAAEESVLRLRLPRRRDERRLCDGRPIPPPTPSPIRPGDPGADPDAPPTVETVVPPDEGAPSANQAEPKPLTEPAGR
ncbi:MAG TPA: DUF4173 domain-containing protein [Allosphingosinicella sp.]